MAKAKDPQSPYASGPPGSTPWGSAVDGAWAHAIEPGRADGRLVAEHTERESESALAPMPRGINPQLLEGLSSVGIDQLYSHQLTAYKTATDPTGRDFVITTATASGKSLAFNLPVLDTLASDPRARALYLYPTKALAQDQSRKLAELGLPWLRHAIYDGDTPREERPVIRRSSNLILTNPDMLHVALLPHHKNWADFFSRLEWVVVDESHVYRGVFGSHVANVIRRLRRIARHYGADPRFACASATIANPAELAGQLVGKEFDLIDDDGAPTRARRIAMWNPPLIDEATGVRRSALSEAAELLADLVIAGMRTICFMRSRKAIELIQKFTQMRLQEQGHGELAPLIAPYRAGYTPQQRRDIEARLANGDLLAVVATNALELGIDIGELDAAICVTFPGTVASLRQMWGRAGRRRDGIAVYLAGEDALDQFFCRHPEEFLGRPVEAAILDHTNVRISSQHLVAAAFEKPLGGPADDEILGDGWQQRARNLVSAGHLRESRGGFAVRGHRAPAMDVSLRSASADAIAVIDAGSGEVIGTVEAERAFSTVHPGAIYLHMGRSYEVRELDLDGRRAIVDPFDGDWYTQARRETETYIEEIIETREPGGKAEAAAQALGCELHFGAVSVSEQVVAFQRKRLGDHEPIDFVALELPEQNFLTQALWYVLPDELAGPSVLPTEVQLGALHAAEHSQIAVLPLLAMCDRWDIGGLSTNVHHQTGRPTIFIYDGYPGGVGIARRGFDVFPRLVGDARRLIGECPCESGCPSCIQSPKCGNLNDPLHKVGALELMDGMLSAGGDSRA